jgi:hypothetical protein
MNNNSNNFLNVDEENKFNYKNIYIKIQNEIKDKIINKYLDKINHLDKLYNQILIENEILKKKLTYIIKRIILSHLYEKQQVQKINFSSSFYLSNNNSKKFLNNSMCNIFHNLKPSESFNTMQTENNFFNNNNMNDSLIIRNNSIAERKSKNFLSNLFKKNMNESINLLTKNSSLYDELFINEKKQDYNNSILLYDNCNMKKKINRKNILSNSFIKKKSSLTRLNYQNFSINKNNNSINNNYNPTIDYNFQTTFQDYPLNNSTNKKCKSNNNLINNSEINKVNKQKHKQKLLSLNAKNNKIEDEKSNNIKINKFSNSITIKQKNIKYKKIIK